MLITWFDKLRKF